MPRTHNQRDAVIAAAVKTRKIAPDREDAYKKLYDADPKGIHHLLTAPVERGGLMAGNAASVAPFDTQPDEYPEGWLPELRGKQVHGQVAFEDGRAATDAHAGALPPRRPATAPRPGGSGNAGRITIEP